MDFLIFLLESSLSYFYFVFENWALAVIALSLALRAVMLPVQTYNYIYRRKPSWKSLVLNLIQIPLFLGIYQVLSTSKNFVAVTFMWIPNLAVPDAVFLLPVIVAVMTYFQIKNGADTAAGGKDQTVLLAKVLPVVSFLFMAALPSALVLYYAAGGAFQVVSEAVLRRMVS